MTTPIPNPMTGFEHVLGQLVKRVAKIDAVAYFNAKETAQYKQSLTGINHSIDGLKFGLAAVTASAQIIKIDFSALKIDEKGVTWLGRTKVTWPWAKGTRKQRKQKEEQAALDAAKAKEEAKKAEQKAEKAEERLASFLTKKEAASTYSTKAAAKRLREGKIFYHHADGVKNRRTAEDAHRIASKAKTEIDGLKETLKKAGKAGHTGVDGNQKQQIRDLRTSVNELSEALAGI